MKRATFTCPACGAAGQRIPLHASIERVVKRTCNTCGVKIQNEVAWLKFAAFGLCTHILLMTLAMVIVMGVLTQQWLMVLVSIGVTAAIVLPVASYLHARHAQASRQDAAVRSSVTRYGRKRGGACDGTHPPSDKPPTAREE